MTKCA